MAEPKDFDALHYAEQLLASAYRRRPTIVVPACATSPMDERSTLVIPQALIDECDALPTTNQTLASPNSKNEFFGILDDAALAVLDRDAASDRQAAVQHDHQAVLDHEMTVLAAGPKSLSLKRAI